MNDFGRVMRELLFFVNPVFDEQNALVRSADPEEIFMAEVEKIAREQNQLVLACAATRGRLRKSNWLPPELLQRVAEFVG